MKKCNENWFSDWFNTSYYHLLYKDRNESEANFFIENIIKHLDPKSDARILDVACGKGRHSHIINQLGYNVTGIDLSKNSIEEAKKKENEKLNFAVHDMREAFKSSSFDYVFNLFTSFGYFNDHKISKTIENSVIHKKIDFTDHGRYYSFTEQVTAFSKKELEQLFENSKLEITNWFGNYKLEEFERESSDRLIIVAKKAS